MDINSEFLIHQKTQIIKHLTLLLKEKSLFNLYLGDTESFITTLLAVDPSKDRIFLDYGPKDYLNKKVLGATTIRFRTTFTGIKVDFEGSDVKSTTYKGHPAFSIAIPKSLLWRQRRQFYRVKSPLSKNSYLKLIIGDGPPIDLHLYDISISGFSVLNESSDLIELLPPGKELNGVQLILEDIATEPVSFIVQYNRALNPNSPKKADKTQKIGCRFTEISLAFESSIQRYMQQIERENKQKS